MSNPPLIAMQTLSNLLQDPQFLYKNMLNDSFEVMNATESPCGQDYVIGFTVQYKSYEEFDLRFLIQFLIRTKYADNTYQILFMTYHNNKIVEITLNDDSDLVEGMTTMEVEDFLTENMMISKNAEQLLIHKLFERLSENRIYHMQG
ncbi:hypothetical protein HYG89_04715 [Acinetobacter sp. SwsAc5]|uniref:hypothetical protein n=2 Tax=Acinetobacter TaxID=469 RepID=UPI0015BB1356|nr:hypothetical protein [Acinetobacter sp. SwsAc5]NWK51867.1 hypothetical protein [Acinetobacter sp. SwsAc5]